MDVVLYEMPGLSDVALEDIYEKEDLFHPAEELQMWSTDCVNEQLEL